MQLEHDTEQAVGLATLAEDVSAIRVEIDLTPRLAAAVDDGRPIFRGRQHEPRRRAPLLRCRDELVDACTRRRRLDDEQIWIDERVELGLKRVKRPRERDDEHDGARDDAGEEVPAPQHTVDAARSHVVGWISPDEGGVNRK